MLSLLGATSGFAGMQLLHHLHVLGPGVGWSILQSGFEADMVGSLVGMGLAMIKMLLA